MNFKVILLTDNQVKKIEFILNRFKGKYFFSEHIGDPEKDLQDVVINFKMITKDENNKNVVSWTSLKKFFKSLTTREKNIIKLRFSNVDLLNWGNDRQVNINSVIFKK